MPRYQRKHKAPLLPPKQTVAEAFNVHRIPAWQIDPKRAAFVDALVRKVKK